MTIDVGERLMSMTDLSEMLGVPIHTLSLAPQGGGPGRLSDWSACEVSPSNSLKRGWRCRRTSTNHSRDVHQDPASGGGPTKLPGLPLADLVIIHSGVHPAKAEAEVDDTFGGIAAPQDVPLSPANKIKIADELICLTCARQPARLGDARWPTTCSADSEALTSRPTLV